MGTTRNPWVMSMTSESPGSTDRKTSSNQAH